MTGRLALLVLAGCSASAPEWQLVTSGEPAALMAVGGTSAHDVWAVGADKGAGPLVLHYDGTAWASLSTGQSGDLWWVHAFRDGPVLFAGANANVVIYDGNRFIRTVTPGRPRDTVFGVWGAAPDDVYAVGSTGGGNGFVWHYDGVAWSVVELPDDTPVLAGGDTPGLFKVWGSAADDVWVVGDRGLVLHKTTAGFSVVPVGSEQRLYTVAGSRGVLAMVGGGTSGSLLEGSGGDWHERAPAAAPLLQGLAFAADGSGYATGEGGLILARTHGQWSELAPGVPLDVESLHAAWIDPDGGLWAVGGNVLSPRLDGGALIHRGAAVALRVRGAAPPASAAQCPDRDIDPRPDASIARRWNEQILASIRIDLPRPTVHARNLFHVSAAMYDAWAAYDAIARGYFVREKHAAADVATARAQTVSYAAYRVLSQRYGHAIGGATDQACYDALMYRLGYDPADAHITGDDPIALGNRIAAAVLAAGAEDGSHEAADYADTTDYRAANPPLFVDQHGTTLADPSAWQPLNLAVAVTQNGIHTTAGTQTYIGAQWGNVTPFALRRPAPGALYHDPGVSPRFGPDIAPFVVDILRKSSSVSDASLIDISPGALGGNSLGANDGHGTPVNPATGRPYASNPVPRGDFGRVLAEFWADGPRSETPPGHWNVLANAVSDSPGFTRRPGGSGSVLDPLEWDVKLYFALNGALHDAAIAAWEVKRAFNTIRPISLVRYMGGLGQSSDPGAPSFHPMGLPLISGLIELVTAESAAPGGRHAALRHHLGQVAILAWPGEPGDRAAQTSPATWLLAVDWVPYQRRTFVTPAFPGFVSGHSTFSRAAAEVLTAFTGSPFFPGGLGEHRVQATTGLTFERGPSVEVRLQWATYHDAADQAGQSRLWGGIHLEPDDLAGRRIGNAVGTTAAALAARYFDGSAP